MGWVNKNIKPQSEVTNVKIVLINLTNLCLQRRLSVLNQSDRNFIDRIGLSVLNTYRQTQQIRNKHKNLTQAVCGCCSVIIPSMHL